MWWSDDVLHAVCEAGALLRAGRVLWAAAQLLIHVIGSVLLMLAGMGTVAPYWVAG